MGRTFTYNRFLNALTLICAALVLWQVGRKILPPRNAQANTVRAGSHLQIPNFRWDAKRTLILALSSYCQYCRASSDFYRALSKGAGDGSYHVAALMKEPESTYAPFVATLGIDSIADIRHFDLERVGVRSTPTVLLADGDGEVTAVWVGKLSPEREREVYSYLKLGAPVRSGGATIADETGLPMLSPSETKQQSAALETVLIDTREREEFDRGHIHGALNLPLDEILSRAPHELPESATVLAYCRSVSACVQRNDKSSTSLTALCQTTSAALGWAGFHKVRFVADDLASLAAAGVRVDGDTCQ